MKKSLGFENLLVLILYSFGTNKVNLICQFFHQVEANDGDMGAEYGEVCKYIIQAVGMPFRINDNGVISLSKPLRPESPRHFTFQVAAVDCGGKMSTKNAVVKISVEDKCHRGKLTG